MPDSSLTLIIMPVLASVISQVRTTVGKVGKKEQPLLRRIAQSLTYR